MSGDWKMEDVLQEEMDKIRKQVCVGGGRRWGWVGCGGGGGGGRLGGAQRRAAMETIPRGPSQFARDVGRAARRRPPLPTQL